MIQMAKVNIFLLSLTIIVIIFTSIWIISTPRYKVLQETRSISIGNVNNDFIISPAKIRITNIWKYRDLVISVKISNGEGDTKYTIDDKAPAVFDEGYYDANNVGGYKYYIDNNVISIKSNSEETLNIKISKQNMTKQMKQEKGFGITQSTNSQGIGINRCYVFEILID